MKKSILLSLTICILFLTAQAQHDPSTLESEIEKIIRFDTEISDENLPGFVLGILDGDSIEVLSYGSRYRDSTVSIDDTSIFEIGGLTKVFTAHLCFLLAQENLLQLEASVNQYLPPEFQNPNLQSITIKHLLSHTSGLPSHPDNLGMYQDRNMMPYSHYTKDNLLEYYQHVVEISNFGKYSYSHVNYALLEIAIENAGQESFTSLMKKHLLDPIGLAHTYLSLEDHRISPGYDRTGRLVNPWLFNSFAASEALKSTVRDLCVYVRFILNDGPTSQLLAAMLMPVIRLPNGRKAYAAYGWHLFKNKKGPNIYLHSGKTDGHAASIHFVVDTKTAVILITNSVVKMHGLSTLVLRLINNNWKR